MRSLATLAWMAAVTALALFSSLDARLCRWLVVVPAAWGVGYALGRPNRQGRDFLLTAATVAGSYALLVGGAWWAGVMPDVGYLQATGPYLFAGMLAPGTCIAGSADPARTRKWIWLGLFAAMAAVIEANNLGWIDYSRIKVSFAWVGWNTWTEKFYVYWLLVLVWAVVAGFSWRNQTDRRVIAVLLALTAVLVWASGRSVRALGIFGCGAAVYFLLTKFPVSRRTLKLGVLVVVLGWGAAPWIFNALDVSRLDPRVGERTRIYRATHEFIAAQPWLGHGFGRARELTHPLLPRRFQQHLPGGHPHNLGLLCWLEYGLAGAVWLGGVTWLLLRRVVDAAHGADVWPALAALVVSFVTMVSFSWDIWDFPIIVFYSASAGLVVMLVARAKAQADGAAGVAKGAP